MDLCDVNIFVHAHREDAPDHAFYRDWLEARLADTRTFLISEFVLSTFVRIVTHPRIFSLPSPLAKALQFAAEVRSASNAVGVMPGAAHWTIFAALCAKAKATGNLVPDAYLAALAIEADAEWITTDRDFQRFEPELRWRLLRA
jgi:hypothetical protein